jgi:hypothetical protein
VLTDGAFMKILLVSLAFIVAQMSTLQEKFKADPRFLSEKDEQFALNA